MQLYFGCKGPSANYQHLCTYILMYFTYSQIPGDHKKIIEGQEYCELGIIFYTHYNCNKNQYKREMEWWLVDTGDVIQSIQDPTPKKLTDK